MLGPGTTTRAASSAAACCSTSPGHRGVPWLEPGEAVTRAELEAVEEAQGVRLGEGDILRRFAPAITPAGWQRAGSNGYDGEGKAGLHVDTIPWE